MAAAVLFSVAASAQVAMQTAQKVYVKWDALVMKKDIAGMVAMIDRSYTMVDPNGERQGYAVTVKSMQEMFVTVRSLKCATTVDKAELYGDELTVWMTESATYETKVDGKWKKSSFKSKYVETLKNTPSGWKFTSSANWEE